MTNQLKFLKACKEGNLEGVKRCTSLSSVDASDVDNWAIQVASRHGHLKIVQYLASLPEVDASDFNNYAFRLASLAGHSNIVLFLLTIKKVRDTLDNRLREEYKDIIDEIEVTEQLKEALR